MPLLHTDVLGINNKWTTVRDCEVMVFHQYSGHGGVHSEFHTNDGTHVLQWMQHTVSWCEFIPTAYRRFRKFVHSPSKDLSTDGGSSHPLKTCPLVEVAVTL